MSHAEAYEYYIMDIDYKQRVLIVNSSGEHWGTIMGEENGMFLVYYDAGDINEFSLSKTREIVENARLRAHEDPGTGTALSPGHGPDE